MKYIKLFESHSNYEGFVEGGTMEKPNVSHCVEENEVHYNPKTWADEYLTFDIIEGGTIVWMAATTATTVVTISYKLNDGDWTEITSSTAGTSFNVSDGDKVRFKGNNAQYGTNVITYNSFSGSTATFNIAGNIMSLISGDTFANAKTLTSNYTFLKLFFKTNIIESKNLILPATTLTQYCYSGMFDGCKSLVTAPELPATTLADSCYQMMFQSCTNLTVVPELPATTLAEHCYEGMFQWCTNLTVVSELSATTMADYCYRLMFAYCRNLTVAPELPATTLANGCYEYMFQGCTSLTTAPELPATTLVYGCYEYMFQGCTSLNYIKCLAIDISATKCTQNWVSGVASSGTFTKAASMSSWTTGVNGIPDGWTEETATA